MVQEQVPNDREKKMESSVASTKVFVSLDEDEAYAATSYSDWQRIVKQMEHFKSVKIEDIEPENRVCSICFDPFGHSDDGKPEEPIQLLSCGHVLGHVCLSNWLATFMANGKWCGCLASDYYWCFVSDASFQVHDENEFREATRDTNVNDMSTVFPGDDQLIRRDWGNYLIFNPRNGEDLMRGSSFPFGTYKASCPLCRNEFSIKRCGLTGGIIEARLRFWDRLYEKLGISRSEKEEQSRTDLLRYVQMVREPNKDITPEHMRSFALQAQMTTMRFALSRGKRDLDPQQAYLRDALFNLGCYGLHEGEYSATSYETRKVPLWCFLMDRVARHRLPIFTADSKSETDPARLAKVRIDFHKKLKQQVSGPWRRALYAARGHKEDNWSFINSDDFES